MHYPIKYVLICIHSINQNILSALHKSGYEWYMSKPLCYNLQSIDRNKTVCSVLGDVVCPLCDPGIVNVLPWWKGCSTDVLCSFNHTLESLPFLYCAVPKPQCGEVGQGALHCTSVEVAEEFGGQSIFPPSPALCWVLWDQERSLLMWVL